MAVRWSKMGFKMAQESPTMAQVSPNMAQEGQRWPKVAIERELREREREREREGKRKNTNGHIARS